MHLSRSLSVSIFALVLMLVGSVVTVAQTDGGPRLEPSYEGSLQLLIGSNDAAARGEVPRNLLTISAQIKNSFGFTNYRLASTLLGRVSNTGDFEYKSLANVFGQELDPKSGTFLEWSMNGFRNLPSAKGQGFQAQRFRFGARVPVTTGTYQDNTGKTNPVINYESIGLSYTRVGVPENVPTLIGTLNLPGCEWNDLSRNDG